jgi:hypothetical protein
VLNPIDTEAVIRDGGAVGQFPGEIHEGVAWWVAACFVVINKADRLAVGCDKHPTTAEFFRRFCQGAINAQHYACKVTALAGLNEAELLLFMQEREPLAGVYLQTSTGADGGDVIRISLYDKHGRPIHDGSGLARIRRMIAEDRVPIPVNERARGSIEEYVPVGEGADE